MVRLTVVFGVLALLASEAPAADLTRPVPTGRFRATCEDLGKLCFAQACGRDQIDAALGCRAQCPSAVTMSVVPDPCPLPVAPSPVILRRRG